MTRTSNPKPLSPEEKALLRNHTTLGKLLTPEQIEAAIALWRTAGNHFHKRCRDEIIVPAMGRINRVTKQKNDPDYLAYAVEFAFVAILGEFKQMAEN